MGTQWVFLHKWVIPQLYSEASGRKPIAERSQSWFGWCSRTWVELGVLGVLFASCCVIWQQIGLRAGERMAGALFQRRMQSFTGCALSPEYPPDILSDGA